MDIKTNDPYLMSVRQYQNINDENSLINVFPIVIDSQLDKKYGQLCRSFLTLSIISQLKTNNILSITKSATTIESPSNGVSNNMSNIMRQLGYTSSSQSDLSRIDIERQQFQAQRQDLSRMEYQDKIDKFLSFIRNQILYDPQFSEFKPYISTITSQNLLSIPLIVGTKYFKLTSDVLYWILFIGIATSTDLSKQGSLKRISQFMKMIPSERYMDLFKIKSDFKFPTFITNPDSSTQMTKFISNTQSGLEKTIMLFDTVLNEKKWNDEVGFGSHTSISITTALNQTKGVRQQIINRTRSLVSTYIANDIIKLVQNSAYTVIGSTDVDLSKYISELSESLINTVEDKTTVIIDMLKSAFERSDSPEQSDNLMDKFKDNCKTLGNIGPLKILSSINQASFNLRDNDPVSFLNFVQNINEPSGKLSALSRELERVIKDVGSLVSDFYESPIDILRNKKDGLHDLIRNHFLKFFDYDNGILKYHLTPTIVKKFNDAINQNKTFTPQNLSIFSIYDEYLKKGEMTKSEIEKLKKDIQNIHNKLTDDDYSLIPLFFNSYNQNAWGSYQYLANDYMNIINRRKNEIDTKSKLIEFTKNYLNDNRNRMSTPLITAFNTLITELTNVPSEKNLLDTLKDITNERFSSITNKKGDLGKYLDNLSSSLTELLYFISLYTILNYFCEYLNEVELNLSVQKTNALTFPHYTLVIPDYFVKGIYTALASHNFNELLRSNSDPDVYIKITESDGKRMTNAIAERLKVPNIIVISESNNEMYYRFAYMKTTNKISISAVSNYVQHQGEVLSGF